MLSGWLSFRHHPEHIRAIHLTSVGEQWLNRGDEGVVFLRIQLDDLAAGILDRLARLLVLLDRELALKRDRLGHRLLHGALEIVRPGVERRAVEKYRPRNIEMRRQRVEFVKLMHAIGDGVSERIFLRVERAGL